MMKNLIKFKNLLKFISVIILVIGLFLCFRYITLNQMYYVDFYQVILCLFLTLFVISMSLSLRRKAKIIEKIETGIIVKTACSTTKLLNLKINDKIYRILNFMLSFILLLLGVFFAVYIGFTMPSPFGFEIIFPLAMIVPVLYISLVLMSNYVIAKKLDEYSNTDLSCDKTS